MRAPETLKAYLAKQGLTESEFAEKVGSHRSQIYRLIQGERGPSIDLAAAIERATRGAVRAIDWASR